VSSATPRICSTRSFTREAPASPASIAVIFTRACSTVSASATPVASVRTSAIGEKVIPSPYGGQRPVRTVASARTRFASSLARRGLADSGRAEHGNPPASAVADGPLESLLEPV
jgi:hypothetical protein